MTISEKFAYLKGLRDGVSVDAADPQVRLLDAVIDLLGDMSAAITDLDNQAMAVSDELDEIEDSLDALETIVYEDYDEEDDEEDEYDEDDEEDDQADEEEDDEDDAVYDFGDEVIYELTCPACGEPITIDEATLEQGSILCPQCGEELEFDMDDEEEPSED